MPLPAEPVAADTVVCRIELSGAKGGHSGGDIAAGRVNAVKALGRVLAGDVRGSSVRAFGRRRRQPKRDPARRSRARLRARRRSRIRLPPRGRGRARGDRPRSSQARTTASRSSITRGRKRTPPRVAASRDVRSTSCGDPDRRRRDDARARRASSRRARASRPPRRRTAYSTLGSMTRSSNAAALDGVLATMHALARLGGAEIEVAPLVSTVGARARLGAPRRRRQATYARLFGTEPTLTVVHGGLECAVLGQRLPGVEMVSIGPEIVGPHAPGEKVRISSTQRFYRLLGALLDDLSRLGVPPAAALEPARRRARSCARARARRRRAAPPRAAPGSRSRATCRPSPRCPPA